MAVSEKIRNRYCWGIIITGIFREAGQRIKYGNTEKETYLRGEEDR